jgi:hypothetical protein
MAARGSGCTVDADARNTEFFVAGAPRTRRRSDRSETSCRAPGTPVITHSLSLGFALANALRSAVIPCYSRARARDDVRDLSNTANGSAPQYASSGCWFASITDGRG